MSGVFKNTFYKNYSRTLFYIEKHFCKVVSFLSFFRLNYSTIIFFCILEIVSIFDKNIYIRDAEKVKAHCRLFWTLLIWPLVAVIWLCNAWKLYLENYIFSKSNWPLISNRWLIRFPMLKIKTCVKFSKLSAKNIKIFLKSRLTSQNGQNNMISLYK